TMYGVEDVRGYKVMTFTLLRLTYPMWSIPLGPWWNRVDDLTRPFLSMMNVRYALQVTERPVPDGWKEIAAQAGTRLLENERVLPRAFIPRNIRVNAPWSAFGPELMDARDFSNRSWIAIEGE